MSLQIAQMHGAHGGSVDAVAGQLAYLVDTAWEIVASGGSFVAIVAGYQGVALPVVLPLQLVAGTGVAAVGCTAEAQPQDFGQFRTFVNMESGPAIKSSANVLWSYVVEAERTCLHRLIASLLLSLATVAWNGYVRIQRYWISI